MLPCTIYPPVLVGTDGPTWHSLPARLCGASQAGQHLASIGGDKDSDVHSFNELFKIMPDGNNVFGRDLRRTYCPPCVSASSP